MNKKNKTILAAVVLGLAALVFLIQGFNNRNNFSGEIVRVGVVGANQAQWDAVNDQLMPEGIKVELVTFNEWTVPNQALNDGEVDLNAFQSRIFFDNEFNNHGYEITIIGETFISPMNIFNGRADIPADYTRTSLVNYVQDGWLIGIPNDVTNGSRALHMLVDAGLIELNPQAGHFATQFDITEFHVNIEIQTFDANLLATALPDLDLAVINNPQALNAGLSANGESIFREDVENTGIAYRLVNVIAARAEDAQNPTFQRIVQAYQTQAVADVFANEFDGAFIPAWNLSVTTPVPEENLYYNEDENYSDVDNYEDGDTDDE